MYHTTYLVKYISNLVKIILCYPWDHYGGRSKVGTLRNKLNFEASVEENTQSRRITKPKMNFTFGVKSALVKPSGGVSRQSSVGGDCLSNVDTQFNWI